MSRPPKRALISVEAEAPPGFVHMPEPGRRELRGALVAVWCRNPEPLFERLGAQLERLRGVFLCPGEGRERLGPSAWRFGVELPPEALEGVAHAYLDLCEAQVDTQTELARGRIELERERADRQRLVDKVDRESQDLRQRLLARSQWTAHVMTALVRLVAEQLHEAQTRALPELIVEFLCSPPLSLASASMWLAEDGAWRLLSERGELPKQLPAPGSGGELVLHTPQLALLYLRSMQRELLLSVGASMPFDEAERSFLGLLLQTLRASYRERELKAALARASSRKDALITELSTPIIQVWHDTVCVPLIGSIDDSRGELLSIELLDAVSRQGLHFVILDLTGLALIDTHTAARLSELVRALSLLGARCTLTGISPAVARTLVGLGVELSGVQTLRTLAAALAERIGPS